MDWKTTLSYDLKAVGAATMVAGALGVPFVSMVGSAASMGSKFLDNKVEKEEHEARFKQMSLGIKTLGQDNQIQRARIGWMLDSRKCHHTMKL